MAMRVFSLKLPDGIKKVMPSPATTYARGAIVDRLIKEKRISAEEAREVLSELGQHSKVQDVE